MNKLMIAAAATLCAAVGYSDITSANIVGYQAADAVYGYSARGASFINVAGGDMDIQSIIPIAPDGESLDRAFQICLMDDGGSTSDTFVYFIANPGKGRDVDGWYDERGKEWVDYSFKEGEAFFYYSDFDPEDVGGGKIQTSGEVDLKEISVNATAYGYQARCNPRAVEVDIQSILPIAPEGSSADRAFQICEMDDGGSTTDTYVWFVANPGKGRDVDGWYDERGKELITRKFGAGEGFFFYTDFDPENGEPSALYFPDVTLSK